MKLVASSSQCVCFTFQYNDRDESRWSGMFVIRVERKRMLEMQVGDRDCSWSGSKSPCFELGVSKHWMPCCILKKKQEMCTTQSGGIKIEKRFKGRSQCHNEKGGQSEPISHPLYQQRTCFARAIPIASAVSCWCIKECSCKVREKACTLQQHSNCGCKVWWTLSRNWRKKKVSIEFPIERIHEKLQNPTVDNSCPCGNSI